MSQYESDPFGDDTAPKPRWYLNSDFYIVLMFLGAMLTAIALLIFRGSWWQDLMIAGALGWGSYYLANLLGDRYAPLRKDGAWLKGSERKALLGLLLLAIAVAIVIASIPEQAAPAANENPAAPTTQSSR